MKKHSRNVENIYPFTFPSCSQTPVVFYHSVIHDWGFFICYVILAIASFLLFDDLCRPMVHQGFYFMPMSSIRVCLVFRFPLSQILLYRSLQTLVIMPHGCWKMMEVYYSIIARSLLFFLTLVVSLPTSLHAFFSLVEGDNLQQIVQETAQGDF